MCEGIFLSLRFFGWGKSGFVVRLRDSLRFFFGGGGGGAGCLSILALLKPNLFKDILGAFIRLLF